MKSITIKKFAQILKDRIKNLKVITNKSFKDLTTFKIGGKILCLVEVDEIGVLLKVIKLAKEFKKPYLVVGAGSNILASDKTCKKVVIKISFNEIKLRDNELICGAGVKLFALNNFAIKNCLSGLEWSFGIPGSLGGAVKMNAGSFGGEIKDVVRCVYYTDGEKIYKKDNKSLEFAYRKSFFSNNDYIILKIVLVLKKINNKEKIEKLCFENYEKRRNLQPYNLPSAGSVFKRPQEDVFVPVLIEKCSLKGFKIGGAQVSKKHCGFIVNLNGNAKFSNVLKIINKIKKTVFKNCGIILQEEIIIFK